MTAGAARRDPSRFAHFAGWVARLRDMAGSSLGGNGLALVAGSAISAVLGLAFWLVTARVFTQEQVGLAAALIAALGALSHAAQLNLRNLVHRFVPFAGNEAHTIIFKCFLGAAAAAALLGAGFVLLVPLVSSELGFLNQSALGGSLFVAALVIWTLYALQEAVLTGLRLSRIVPVQTLAYSIAKIVLVLAAGVAAGTWAFGGEVVVAIWVVPAALIGLIVHVRIQQELNQDHWAAAAPGEKLDRQKFLRFFGWDYAGSLATSIAHGLIPILVLSMTGAAASAQYQMAWTISYTLYLVGRHMGAAMQSEVGRHPEKRRALYAATLVYTLLLVVPAALVAVLFAPQIMLLFGENYVAEGAPLLRLFALSVIPLSIVTVLLAIARSENFFAGVAAVQIATLLLAVALGALALVRMGPVGMALAWLVTHSLVLAASLLVMVYRTDRIVLRAFVFDLTSALSRTLNFARQLFGVTLSPVSLSDARTALGRNVTKSGATAAGREALLAEHDALTYLSADRRLRRFRHLLPRIESFDPAGELRMTRLLGREGRQFASNQHMAAQLAAETLAEMHAAIATEQMIDSQWLAEWIDQPLELISAADISTPSLRETLVDAFAGSRQMLGLGHGDLCLDNVLYETDRSRIRPLKVTGIVDWGQARLDSPAFVDPLHLVLTQRMRGAGRELGPVLVDLLNRPELSAEEEALVGVVWQSGPEDLRRAMLLLVWLQHVSNNVQKSELYRPGTFWHAANVKLVVGAVNRKPAAAEQPHPKPEKVRRPAPVSNSEIESAASAGSTWRTVAASALLLAGLALWWITLPQIEPGEMGAFGLISVLPNQIFAAYGLVIMAFVLSLSGKASARLVPLACLAAMVLLLHATPAISYETLRYSWAWKHVGVIDFIMRTGELDPTAQFLSAYFNWPAFFLAMAGIANLFGLDPLGIADLARFFPVLLNALYAVALLGIFTNLGAGRRTGLVAAMLFLLGNWVGQDYFSPQGTAFLFYLCLIYLVTGPLAQRAEGWRGTLLDRIHEKSGFEILPDDKPLAGRFQVFNILAALVLTLMIVATHQLTPLLMLSALFGLFAIGRLRFDYFLFGLVAQLLWLFYFADSFMAAQLVGILESLGNVGQDTVGKLVDLTQVSDSQRIVALASRGLSAAIILLGLLGGLVRLWGRRLDLSALVLLLAAIPLAIVTPYGGEIIFRAYFFALPFAAYFAAHLFTSVRGMGFVRAAALALVIAAAVPTFILANNGKDEQYRFTPEEVAASDWLYSRSEPGELLIEGTRSYPSQFRNYENFIYVPLSEELPGIAEELATDPAAMVTRWLRNAPNGGYVIVTRSMKAVFDSLGLLPAGGLERVEQELLRAPQLQVAYSNEDAVIFSLRN